MRNRREPELIVPPELLELADHVRAIDRVIHQPDRLAIFFLLLGNEAVSFREVQEQTGLTAGNVGAHISTLEHAGYVDVLKAFEDRRPITRYRLTSAGQAAWATYWGHVNALLGWLEEARNHPKPPHWPGDRRVGPGRIQAGGSL